MRSVFMPLTLVVLGFPLVTGAQTRGPIDKGSMLVAGTAAIQRSTFEFGDNESSSTGITINPTVLFFVAPRFAIGGQLGLSRVNFDDGNSSSWLLGPAARFYFGESSSKTLPFVGASFSFGGTSTESDDVDDESESDTWGLEGVAGITWMVSRQVGITGEAFLGRTEFENDGFDVEQSRTDLGIRFGIAAFLFR